jgi:5-methyltetrahydrofolate--homocysteine methyltransferase
MLEFIKKWLKVCLCCVKKSLGMVLNMTQNTFEKQLASKKILICDGGMGTQLQKLGLPIGVCGDIWNLENPRAVATVHNAYLDAGVDILITNTFSSNQFRLAHYGLADRVEEVVRQAVQTLLEVVSGTPALVFGDLGPLGEFLEPVGDISRDDAVKAFREAAEVFADTDVDEIIIETISAPEEMECAVEAVRSVSSQPVVASFTFGRTPAGLRTMTGATPEECALLGNRLGVDVLGVNCGTDLDGKDYVEIIRRYAQASDLPILVEPNAGKPSVINGSIVYPATPEEMASWVPELISAGARIIGGCCGTTPEHIRAIAEAARKVQS